MGNLLLFACSVASAALEWKLTDAHIEVERGTEFASVSFPFRNKLDYPIPFPNVNGSCECLVLQPASDIIPAQGEAAVEVRVRVGNAVEPIRQSLTVRSADTFYNLRLTVVPKAWFDLSPSFLRWDRKSISHDRIVEIKGQVVSSVTLYEVDPNLRAELLPIGKEAGARLRVSVVNQDFSGYARIKMIVTRNDGRTAPAVVIAQIE